jgi:hypothetical protein
VEQHVIAFVAGAGADGDVVDREVAEVKQLIAPVPGDELIQAHERAVHAEPDKVARLHSVLTGNGLEVRQVADQFEGLVPGGQGVTEQVPGHQVSQRDAVQPFPQGVLPAADQSRDLGPHVPEGRIEITQEHLVHRQHLLATVSI